MAYTIEKTQSGRDLVISGLEKGIAASPYNGIGNIQNLSTTYYPGVAYVNYRRQACTFTQTGQSLWFAGTHSTNVSNNVGWYFTASTTFSMTNPVQKATSPVGLNYILDDSGQIWKQTAVNSTVFNYLAGRTGTGAGGLAYWNNYLVVFGGTAIEFCGNGVNDAGVVQANWNTLANSSTVTVTCSYVLFGTNFTAAVLTGATTATLASNFLGASGTYSVKFNNNALDVRNATFTNGSTAVSWSGGLTNDTPNPGQISMYQLLATSGTFSGSVLFSANSGVTFSSTGTLPTNITAGTTYYLTSTVDLTGSTIFTITSTYGGTIYLPQTDGGTGTITMSLLQSTVPPIQNTTITGFTWGTNGIGSTTITLTSLWQGATGIYNIVDPVGNNFTASFTYESLTVTLTNPASVQESSTGTFNVQIINTSATTNRAYISKVDGNLYFANGRWVGRISSSPNFNIIFNPGVPASYSINYSVTGTLQPQDTVVDMTDLRGTMVIAGNFDVYPWDYVSSQPSASSPVGEQTYRIINNLNNVYILAGTKGNIYVSNGYSAQLLYKLPDFIAGVIDPIWKWGDLMVHRSKLFFQAFAQTSAGANVLAGIFSTICSPSILGETASGLVMEAQNSYGLTPTSGALSNGCLIDNEPYANQDSYYSAWSNGATTGGIDYNDSSGWQNFEPTIETDIIPIGTFLEKATLGQIEFKLDRPMATGDQLKLFYRVSLSDSYTQIGSTFTNLQLSDIAPSAISLAQWVQFKVQFKCASSGSSFLPLKELRIHLT